MDPFSLSLGVLQVTGVALKLSMLLYTKLKVFRNYSREVRRVIKDVERQHNSFMHEIHLILQQAKQDEAEIEQMLEDQEHCKWRSITLQNELGNAFGKSLDTIQETIEDIGSILQSLQGELCCFDEIVDMREKDEPLKDAVRRLRKRVKITLNKSKFEEQIQSLRQLNKDLRRIRKQEVEIKKSNSRTIAPTYTTQQLSQEFGSIGKVRRASKAFHQALAAAWLSSLSPASTGQLKHNVKLLLDAQVKDEVQMEVMITCYGHCLSSPNSVQLGLIRLHVESRVVFDSLKFGLQTPPDSDDGRYKKRRVHFAMDDAKEDAKVSDLPDQQLSPVNLQDVQDICAALNDQSPCRRPSRCLGYLESCANETFRHSFFQTPGDIGLVPATGSLSISMSEILSHPVEASVTVVDQFRLARNFAMAVLKFHSTPWLGEYFSLRDLSFFRLGEGDISSYLQTAHLGFDFIQASPGGSPSVPMKDADEQEAAEDARLFHGIRNLALWSLGAAMLQIENWSAIESQDDVVKVRRMAQKPVMIGERYRALAKQCLECDFGFGDDLSKPRLQQAVYEKVVCGLTDMIDSLSLE